MLSIKGQTVILHVLTETGRDDFNAPIYSDDTVAVENVLIEPASNEAITNEFQLHGKRIAYVLHIPKNDDHNWKDTIVEFYGDKWQTYGDSLVWDSEMTPLDWNKKVKVERYGGSEV